jgi:adenylate cyclase
VSDSDLWAQVTAMRYSGRVYARVAFANLIGAALVAVQGIILSHPAGRRPNHYASDVVVSSVVGLAIIAVAVPADIVISRRRANRTFAWVDERRPPTQAEQAATLRYPWVQTADIFCWWLGGAVVEGLLNGIGFHNSVSYALRTSVAISLGGLTTSALCFLLLERVNRPIWRLALAGEVPERAQAVGLERRLLLSWALGGGVPLIIIGTAPIGLSAKQRAELTVPLLVFLGIGLSLGLLVTRGAARSIAEPLSRLRHAQRQVQDGDLDIEVPVDDGGEVGQLQAGFNRMVAGLRERQRLHDLFGRHVGAAVARQALSRGVQLGGELQEASVLFVDLVGSTAMALRLPPDEVVALLNDVFAAVVRCTAAQEGWVNKFEGDAALCVFGPPAGDSDHASHALGAARALRAELLQLADRHPGLDAGIGVSSGTVVAANVGAEDRSEYTVIGDPVNEAARLTEAAKGDSGRVLASAAAVRCAGDEGSHWEPRAPLLLRGRDQPTDMFAPRC